MFLTKYRAVRPRSRTLEPHDLAQGIHRDPEVGPVAAEAVRDGPEVETPQRRQVGGLPEGDEGRIDARDHDPLPVERGRQAVAQAVSGQGRQDRAGAGTY